MKDYEASWERLASSLSNLSPLNILKKGYTICWKGKRSDASNESN